MYDCKICNIEYFFNPMQYVMYSQNKLVCMYIKKLNDVNDYTLKKIVYTKLKYKPYFIYNLK